MTAEFLAQITKQLQDYGPSTYNEDTDQPIAIHFNDIFAASLKAEIIHYYQEINTLLSNAKNSENPIDSAKEQFIALYQTRCQDEPHAALRNETACDQMFWDVAKQLFAPATFSEICQLLSTEMNVVSLSVEAKKADATAKLTLDNVAYSSTLEENTLEQLKLNDENDLKKLVIVDNLVFDIEEIARFTLKMHRDLAYHKLHASYPSLAKAIYQFNEGFIELERDIKLLDSNLSIDEVIEKAAMEMRRGGSKITNMHLATGYAAIAARDLCLFIKESLPEKLKLQILALKTGDKTLGDVLAMIDKEECVETTSSYLFAIIKNPENKAILQTSLGLSETDREQITSKYKNNKEINITRSEISNFTFPLNKFSSKTIKKIRLEDIEDYINAITSLPIFFYKDFFFNVNSTESKTDVLRQVIQIQGIFSSEQYNAIIKTFVALIVDLIKSSASTIDSDFNLKLQDHFFSFLSQIGASEAALIISSVDADFLNHLKNLRREYSPNLETNEKRLLEKLLLNENKSTDENYKFFISILKKNLRPPDFMSVLIKIYQQKGMDCIFDLFKNYESILFEDSRELLAFLQAITEQESCNTFITNILQYNATTFHQLIKSSSDISKLLSKYPNIKSIIFSSAYSTHINSIFNYVNNISEVMQALNMESKLFLIDFLSPETFARCIKKPPLLAKETDFWTVAENTKTVLQHIPQKNRGIMLDSLMTDDAIKNFLFKDAFAIDMILNELNEAQRKAFFLNHKNRFINLINNEKAFPCELYSLPKKELIILLRALEVNVLTEVKNQDYTSPNIVALITQEIKTRCYQSNLSCSADTLKKEVISHLEHYVHLESPTLIRWFQTIGNNAQKRERVAALIRDLKDPKAGDVKTIVSNFFTNLNNDGIKLYYGQKLFSIMEYICKKLNIGTDYQVDNGAEHCYLTISTAKKGSVLSIQSPSS